MAGYPQILSALLLILALPATAGVSRLQLVNGDVLTGTIQTQDKAKISLQLAYAGLVQIKRSDILKITAVTDLQSTAAKKPELSATPEGTSASEMPEQTVALAKPWSLELDVSASNRHGEQNSSVLNLELAAEYNHQDWRTSLDSHFDYELKELARKTHKYDIKPGLDYFIYPRLFWRGSIDYEYNYLASDYLNIDFSTGPGYAVLQQANLTLDLVAATGIKKAYFREEDEITRGLLFGKQINYKFASLEWDLKYHPQDWQIEFYSQGTWLHLLDQPVDFLYFDYKATADFGIRYRLTDKIRLSWGYQYDKTDLELRLTGIPSISFNVRNFKQKLSVGASF
jgi:putative salt-induced outer membrane protein YdiY